MWFDNPWVCLFIVTAGVLYFYEELVAKPRAIRQYREESQRNAVAALREWIRRRREKATR